MELKSSPETEDYRHFDPKQLRQTDGAQASKSRAPFHEAIVFVVGGGNYIEYQNLVDYAKVTTSTMAYVGCVLMVLFSFQSKGVQGNKRVIYGSTSLFNAKQFLKQVGQFQNELKPLA